MPTRNDALPSAISQLLTKQMKGLTYATLQQLGIEIGQGLRTGCNVFFYVTALDHLGRGDVVVEAAGLFGHRRFSVPETVVQKVLRRQSELKAYWAGTQLAGRVLVLRGWALPEDISENDSYTRNWDVLNDSGIRILPKPLAEFIRLAAQTRLKGGNEGLLIPELSAVRTNVRTGKDGSSKRFWYTLPDFAPRHRPAAFVPRIIQDTPWVEANAADAFLVDANFSTFWADSGSWSGAAIKALLNSSWCRAYMEATGTPMGGGALKLEATHLRRMLLPPLPKDAIAHLHVAGESLNGSINSNIESINSIVLNAICRNNAKAIKRLECALSEIAINLSASRQRMRVSS